jgi:hypothetical protein
MDRQPGASIALSFGLVGLFAIILYQPDRTPLPRAGENLGAHRPEHPAGLPPPMPPLTAAEPLAAVPEPPPAPPPPVIVPVAAATSPPSQPHVLQPGPEGFTLALEGETLRDVAIRVYGSADEAEALWRLNRDLVGKPDASLGAGTLLRTP